MNAPLAEMFRYNKWANLQLFEACHALSDGQLDATPSGASGTVRVLLLHLVGSQQTFVLRTKGRQHEGELTRESAWPAFDTLIELVTASSDELIAIAEAVDLDSDVDLPFQGKAYRYPRTFFLLHAMAHGVEHRTEIKNTLARDGIATPDLDAWVYSTVRGWGREV